MISAAFPYQKQRRQVLGSEMAYVEVGEGEPIVLLHGWQLAELCRESPPRVWRSLQTLENWNEAVRIYPPTVSGEQRRVPRQD